MGKYFPCRARAALKEWFFDSLMPEEGYGERSFTFDARWNAYHNGRKIYKFVNGEWLLLDRWKTVMKHAKLGKWLSKQMRTLAPLMHEIPSLARMRFIFKAFRQAKARGAEGFDAYPFTIDFYQRGQEFLFENSYTTVKVARFAKPKRRRLDPKQAYHCRLKAWTRLSSIDAPDVHVPCVCRGAGKSRKEALSMAFDKFENPVRICARGHIYIGEAKSPVWLFNRDNITWTMSENRYADYYEELSILQLPTMVSKRVLEIAEAEYPDMFALFFAGLLSA